MNKFYVKTMCSLCAYVLKCRSRCFTENGKRKGEKDTQRKTQRDAALLERMNSFIPPVTFSTPIRQVVVNCHRHDKKLSENRVEKPVEE